MLKYQDMWDMPLAGPTAAKKIPHWFGNVLYAVLWPLTKLLFRWRVDELDKLRAFQDKGVLIVCNHTSFLDVVFIWLVARPSQWVRFMARENLFEKACGILGQAISRIGAFPVARDSADRTAVKRAARMLKDGEAVGIMPEGTRRGKGTAKMQLHAGAAFVAKMGKAPILPMTVRNAEKVKQKGKMLKFPKITLEFGDPILLEDFDCFPKADRLEACTWYAMRECFALFYNKPADQVDMVALFPETRDYSADFAEHSIPKHTSEELTSPKPAIQEDQE